MIKDYEERLKQGAENCFRLLEEIGELRQKNRVHEETIKEMKEIIEPYKRQKEFAAKEYKNLIEENQKKSTKIKDLEAEIEAIRQEKNFAEKNYAALQEHIKRLSCEVKEYRNKERAEQDQQYNSKYKKKY